MELFPVLQIGKHDPFLAILGKFFAPRLSRVSPSAPTFFGGVCACDPPSKPLILGTNDKGVNTGCVSVGPDVIFVAFLALFRPELPEAFARHAVLKPILSYLVKPAADKPGQAFRLIPRPLSRNRVKGHCVATEVLPGGTAPPLLLRFFVCHEKSIAYADAFLIISGIINIRAYFFTASIERSHYVPSD